MGLLRLHALGLEVDVGRDLLHLDGGDGHSLLGLRDIASHVHALLG